MRFKAPSINSGLTKTGEKPFSPVEKHRDSAIKIPARSQPRFVYLVMWGCLFLLLVGITGCGSNLSTPTAPPLPTSSSSFLPASLAEAVPSKPQDPELMVKALRDIFIKWALAGNLQDSPEVLAAFHNLLTLSDLEPTATMQSWLSDAQTQASGQEPTDFAALETDVAGDFKTLSLDESFFYLWQHGQENPDTATDAGIRLALIVAVGDENLQREIVRAWRQLTE